MSDALTGWDEEHLERRVPRDEFERALFRTYLMDALRDWRSPHYTASLGDEVGEGVWELRIIPNEHMVPAEDAIRLGVLPDPDQLPPLLIGTIWVAERPGAASLYLRVTGAWELPVQDHLPAAQRNTTEFRPTVPWALHGEGGEAL